MKTIVFLFVAVLASNAFGRIGETLDQCKARYGAVMMQKEDRFIFTKNGIGIVVQIHKGKAAIIFFTKQKDDESLSESEIKTLLDANGKEWIRSKAPNGDPIWITKDKSVKATYLKEDDRLVIMDAKASDEMEKETADAEKKRLQGF